MQPTFDEDDGGANFLCNGARQLFDCQGVYLPIRPYLPSVY